MSLLSFGDVELEIGLRSICLLRRVFSKIYISRQHKKKIANRESNLKGEKTMKLAEKRRIGRRIYSQHNKSERFDFFDIDSKHNKSRRLDFCIFALELIVSSLIFTSFVVKCTYWTVHELKLGTAPSAGSELLPYVELGVPFKLADTLLLMPNYAGARSRKLIAYSAIPIHEISAGDVPWNTEMLKAMNQNPRFVDDKFVTEWGSLQYYQFRKASGATWRYYQKVCMQYSQREHGTG